MLSFNSSPLSVFKSKKSNGSLKTNGTIQVREVEGSSSSSSGEDSPPPHTSSRSITSFEKPDLRMPPPIFYPHSGSSNGPKGTKTETHVLREITTLVTVRCKKELSSKHGEILTSVSTCHAFLDFIAAERLRSMPHQGSKWDKVLKWAEAYARKLDTYTHAVCGFAPYSWESARLVWGSCQLLLRMGPKHINLLEKIFGLLYQFCQTLDFFLKSKNLFSASAEIQNILSQAYADLVRFTVEVTIHYKTATTIVLTDFDLNFGRAIDSFFHRKDCFTSEVWTCSLKETSTTTTTSTSTVTIHTIREWLACHDRTLEVFLSDRMGTRTCRHEYTCEWFESHLRGFQRSKKDDVLWITGKPGCGKTILTGWILEKLRRSQVKGRSYDVISFSIDGNLKSQRSSTAVVKSLLLQILETNVGDADLFKVLTALYERTEKGGVTDNLDSALWKAFESALERTTNKLMLVIDGLDQLEGGEHAAWELAERLQKNAAQWCDIKVILLSRPLSKPCGAGIKSFMIEQSHIRSDIRRYVEIIIKNSKEFRSLKAEERTIIIEKITTSKSCTSFVYARHMIELLKKEKTFVGIEKCLGSLPATLDSLLGKSCLNLDFTNTDTRLIVSCLLAAERPLTVREVKALLEIEVTSAGCSHNTRLSSAEDDIRNACGSLVTIRDGLVCFGHLSIKQQVIEHCTNGKFKLTIAGAHSELVTRMMAYLKLTLKDRTPTPAIGCTFDDKEGLVSKHTFLEYAARYWTAHFTRSTMFVKGGKHICSTEFTKCFPDNGLVALIEGSWWETQTCAADAAVMHELALTVRKLCLGEHHKAVVQCYINVACTHQRTSTWSVASDCYYAAWEVVRKVYDETHKVAISCADQYVVCTKEITTTTKTKHTEVTTKRTEVIYKYMWTAHKTVHGECHKETIKYAKCLAELYVTLKKTELAITVYREVHMACVKTYGELHEETLKITQTLITVLSTSTSTKHTEECTRLTQTLVTACEKTLECWDERRITATIRLVTVYEGRKDIKHAEETLLALRRAIIAVCVNSREEHHHAAKIEITLQYVRFLQRHRREKEAERVLIELWGEFKALDQHNHSDRMLVRIRCIGEEMRKLKIVTVAESVFSSLYGFYKKVSKSTTTEATSIAIALSEILRTREEHGSEERILVEIYEAAEDEVSCVRTCDELCGFYEREEKWTLAIEVCIRTLTKVWAEILTTTTTTTTTTKGCGLPKHSHGDIIAIARRLAICYAHAGRIEEAEHIYLAILRSCRASLALHDELVLTTAVWLVEFYESAKKYEAAIKVYEALYDEYRSVLGASHSLTIKLTYKLAHFCKVHQPRRAERFYLAIVSAHGHECRVDSIDAMLVLCRIYEADKKRKDACNLYRSLWATFCNSGSGECGMSEETVIEVYHAYVRLLETHEQKLEVSIQFRTACTAHYGKFAATTIKATIALARLLEQSSDEKYHIEATAIYEEVITIITKSHTLSITMASVIVEVRTRLAQLYSAHASSTAKAEAIYFESWESCRTSHGYAHATTLARLRELVLYFHKTAAVETASTTLQRTVIEIVRTERDTAKLFAAACALAQLWLTIDCRTTAFELIKEIRRQVSSTSTTKTTSTSKSKGSEKFGGFTLDVDRRAFVFVVAFEETLTGHAHEGMYAAIMSDLMTETTLFESWMRALQYGSAGGFEASLSVGARLRLFLLSKSRDDEGAKVTDELWTLFVSEVCGSSEKKKVEKGGIVWQLFLVCIGDDSGSVSVLDAGVTAVITHYDKGDFEAALQLAQWVHRYVTTAHGGFASQDTATIAVGFRLALCLAGTETVAWKRCQNQQLTTALMALSRTILTEVLSVSVSSVSTMSLTQLDSLCTLLGSQSDFTSLERILRTLWDSRHTQTSWTPDTIVSIGLRLCEVLFAHGHKEEALTLCADICYNLRRVWGSLDASTVRAFNLLSAFHTASGDVAASIALHEDIMQQTLSPENEDELAETAGEVILQQLRLLKRGYQRNGCQWPDVDDIHNSGSGNNKYEGLWMEFKDLFGERHEMWGRIDDLKHWGRKGGVEGELGMWTPPKRWGFLGEKGQQQVHSHACHGSGEEDGGSIEERVHGSGEGRGLANGHHHHHHLSIGNGQAFDDLEEL